MGTLKTTNIQSISGSGTVTLGVSGETFDIPSGVTLDSTGATITGALTMTPAFHAYNNADQNISASTLTQVVFNTEIYDTDNAFASNQFTVPSGKGGKYFVYFRIGFATGTDFAWQATVQINSAFNADSGFRVNQNNWYYDNIFSGQVFDLSAGDVARVMIYQADSTLNVSGTENRANFGGYRIIGA